MAVTTASDRSRTEPAPARPSPAFGPRRSAVAGLYAVLGALLAAYCVDLVLGGPGGSYPDWLSGWGVDAFELTAGLMILARGVVRPRDRRYALLLGAASCAWALGDFAMTAETLNGATPATISVANALWACF